MGGKKIQSMWGSATNFALAGALFGGSIVLLFLFCYCCQRSKTKKPPAPSPTPRTISNLSDMTASTTNPQEGATAPLAPPYGRPWMGNGFNGMELTDISVIEAMDDWQQHPIPRPITPPPPYEQVAYKKTFRTTDSPPSYDTAMAAMQSYGYV